MSIKLIEITDNDLIYELISYLNLPVKNKKIKKITVNNEDGYGMFIEVYYNDGEVQVIK